MRQPLSKRSVTLCPKCGADSQIEETRKQDTRYVKRIRGCVACGNTWTTAEVHLNEVHRLQHLDQLLKTLKKAMEKWTALN